MLRSIFGFFLIKSFAAADEETAITSLRDLTSYFSLIMFFIWDINFSLGVVIFVHPFFSSCAGAVGVAAGVAVCGAGADCAGAGVAVGVAVAPGASGAACAPA